MRLIGRKNKKKGRSLVSLIWGRLRVLARYQLGSRISKQLVRRREKDVLSYHLFGRSVMNIVDGMRTIMSDIEALKSERFRPDTVGDPTRQLYQESMLTEMKNMRLESRAQLLDIKDMLAEYKSITSYVVTW